MDRENTSAKEVLSETNVEKRHAGCQILGWHRIGSELGMKVLDGDPDTEHGALVELDLPDIGKGRFLMAICPRNGKIAEGVPMTYDDGDPINTVLAAQAWRVGLKASDFEFPEIRT